MFPELTELDNKLDDKIQEQLGNEIKRNSAICGMIVGVSPYILSAHAAATIHSLMRQGKLVLRKVDW